MSSSLAGRSMLRLGALVILGAACSNQKNAEQQRAEESAASAPAGTQSSSMSAADSTASPTAVSSTADTSGKTGGDTSSSSSAADRTAQASTAGTAKRAKPPVKPSIDPGRKTPPTRTLPAAQPAGTDSSAKPTSGARTSASAAEPADTPSQSSQGQPLKWDAASKTATFQLIGGPSGFQFNGYSSGGATLTLPPNANVVMNFINKDGTPHSAEIISGEGPLPNSSNGETAIPRAYTRQLVQGLPQEGTDVMQFQVPASGSYRIFCGVPGHGLSGMWIWMKVDPAAKVPSFGPTKS